MVLEVAPCYLIDLFIFGVLFLGISEVDTIAPFENIVVVVVVLVETEG